MSDSRQLDARLAAALGARAELERQLDLLAQLNRSTLPGSAVENELAARIDQFQSQIDGLVREGAAKARELELAREKAQKEKV